MSGSDSPTFFHGQPWSSWIERIGRDKPLSDEETDAQPSSSVTRLSVEDIDLYGFCPERDLFYGVVCEICNAIVKPQALIQHMESRHPSGTANFPPPPTPTVKPTVKIPYCKVSKLKKSQTPAPTIPVADVSTKLNHTAVKRNVEQASLSAGSGSLPISSSPRSPLESITVQTTTPSNVTGSSVGTPSPSKSPVVASSGQPRRKRLKADRSLLKDREYDPDRHCGVWNEETGKPCTRSLTCKAHTVSLRRTVVGRSKTFDKLLAEHRAAKEQPTGSGRAATKMTVSGTVTVSSVAASSLNPHAPNTPVSAVEPEAPSSPPVLSLPDSYPLPKTKLEEDFANAEELQSLESSLVNSSAAAVAAVAVASNTSQQQPSSMMAPISVMLPSLSPLPGNSEESPVATLIPSTTTAAMPVVPAPLPATCVQPPAVVATVLEGETPMDIDTETISATMYSPVYAKETKSQLVMQAMSRPNSHSQSPVQSARSYQMQASLSSLNLFEPVEQLEQQHASQINGKRLNHASPVIMSSRQQKRHKSHDYQSSQDFTTTTTSIQVEATTTSSPYSHFGDISWSNCHPEPLAVSRWLRISSSRKQYNFNIH
ncbi:ataxin-7-like protein 1 isoform X2 [Harpegnathos saltator]|uniref:ataxin-7-like protein 1 isoform X2 n=1 Tax=Harpegnathos saltator TaxID=610380 RepID=UPI000DBEEB1F|nr:ataxin-7-like protein 1 isoform X2 [Harpegnathos saltator]